MRLADRIRQLRQNRNNDDLGFSSKYYEHRKRLLNKDGSMNVERLGTRTKIYHHLIRISWTHFLLSILAFYTAINSIFAFFYMSVGLEGISGINRSGLLYDFLNAFYFSSQTMTTLGYGAMAPVSPLANFIASIEALVGLLCFALATGLVYGRFSRPEHSIRFTEKAIISPYKDITSLQFRVANQSSHQLMDLEAKLLLTLMVKDDEGTPKQQYHQLELQTSRIHMLPLNWTIVHPIDENSPLYGMTADDLKEADAEFLVLIQAYDEAFSMNLHSRSSYRFDEIDWNVRYRLAYQMDSDGTMVFDIDRLGEVDPA